MAWDAPDKLDHGTVSTLMIVAPVQPSLLLECPRLDILVVVDLDTGYAAVESELSSDTNDEEGSKLQELSVQEAQSTSICLFRLFFRRNRLSKVEGR